MPGNDPKPTVVRRGNPHKRPNCFDKNPRIREWLKAVLVKTYEANLPQPQLVDLYNAAVAAWKDVEDQEVPPINTLSPHVKAWPEWNAWDAPQD